MTKFPNIKKLAKELRAPIVVFDLEATTFRGRPNFGITEVALAIVFPDDTPTRLVSSLVNPEAPISPEVSKLTGITNSMVSNKPTWGDKFAKFFKTNEDSAWFVGFNSNSFDIPAVKDMNNKYGVPLSDLNAFDVRKLYLDIFEPESKKGTLVEVSQLLGISIPEGVHRAATDVFLTARCLDVLIERCGLSIVSHYVLATSDNKLNAKNLLKAVSKMKDSPISLKAISAKFNTDPSVVYFEICKLMDSNKISSDVFENHNAVSTSLEVFKEIPEKLLKSGDLKTLFKYISSQLNIEGFDYLQLRIALNKWKLLETQNA